MRTATPTTILLEAWDAYGEHEASACSLCLLNRSCEVRDELWERLCRVFDGLRVLEHGRGRQQVTLEEFEEMCRRLSEYTRVHGVKGLVATVDETDV